MSNRKEEKIHPSSKKAVMVIKDQTHLYNVTNHHYQRYPLQVSFIPVGHDKIQGVWLRYATETPDEIIDIMLYWKHCIHTFLQIKRI